MRPTRRAMYLRTWNECRRHPIIFLRYWFTAVSVLWTLLQLLVHFSGTIGATPSKFNSLAIISVFVFLAITWALHKMWQPSHVTVRVKTTDTIIEIMFSDLFSQSGLRAIGVTKYFESEVGTAVAANSLHGKLLTTHFGGGTADFDAQLAAQLTNGRHVAAKTVGKQIAYPIGTIAIVEVRSQRYILFALADADPATCKARSDIGTMLEAMQGLWDGARVNAGGAPVNVPLIGSGQSGVGAPHRELLNLIVLSAIAATKKQKVTNAIKIVLEPARYNELDLRGLKTYWEES